MTLQDILERLESYRHYEQGWDSYDAAPFAGAHVDYAARVAMLLADDADLLHVAPYSGGIQLELRHEGRFAELDVVAPGVVYVLSGTEHPLVFGQEDDEYEGEQTAADEAALLRLARRVRSGGRGQGAGGRRQSRLGRGRRAGRDVGGAELHTQPAMGAAGRRDPQARVLLLSGRRKPVLLV